MKCHVCGTSYDGEFCPNCGTPAAAEMQTGNDPAIIPNKSIKKPFYKKWWFWVIIAVLIIVTIWGLGDSKEAPDNNDTDSLITQSSEDTNSNSTENKDINSSAKPSNDNSGVVETAYASDDTVNRFISEFNKYSDFDMSDISKGNIRTKFFAHANGCYIEMINANDATANYFLIKINGGKETADRAKMLDVAADVIKVLDPSITDDKVAQTITHLESQTHMLSDYKVTEDVLVETYVPIVELSYGKSDCRVDIISYNYK